MHVAGMIHKNLYIRSLLASFIYFLHHIPFSNLTHTHDVKQPSIKPTVTSFNPSGRNYKAFKPLNRTVSWHSDASLSPFVRRDTLIRPDNQVTESNKMTKQLPSVGYTSTYAAGPQPRDPPNGRAPQRPRPPRDPQPRDGECSRYSNACFAAGPKDPPPKGGPWPRDPPRRADVPLSRNCGTYLPFILEDCCLELPRF